MFLSFVPPSRSIYYLVILKQILAKTSREEKKRKVIVTRALVAYAYNPRYLGGSDLEAHGLKPARKNSL
jgi:hypothetical protein